MKIKDKFELFNAQNVMDIPKHTMKSMLKEVNDARQIPVILELKKNSIKHFSKNSIYTFVSKQIDIINVVSMDNYPLSVSYNAPSDTIVINLKPTDVIELANMPVYDLYATLVYGYYFRSLMTGRERISEDFAGPIISYLSSVFVRVFGKQYGLTETFSGAIPKLKFLLSCYVLAAFFGYRTDLNLFRKAIGFAPYNYMEDDEKLLKYDFFKIKDFLLALSDFKVMPGIKHYMFTTKIYTYFGINMLPGFEDLSRFICGIIMSSVRNQRLISSHIYKYNEKEYNKILKISERYFKSFQG
jgi:hypothetical protein